MTSKIEERNERELLLNALLEASQNLLEKMDKNREDVSELERQSKGGYQERKGE